MSYLKNLPLWERVLRIALGVFAVGFALWYREPIGWVVAGVGATLALTGAVGFCPMRALVGRRPRN
jgi:Protein of unknown function (DUF2892)